MATLAGKEIPLLHPHGLIRIFSVHNIRSEQRLRITGYITTTHHRMRSRLPLIISSTLDTTGASLPLEAEW